MRAVEFESTVSAGGHIVLPPEVAGEIAAGEPIRIVMMWQTDEADDVWRAMGRKRFEAAYDPADSVYEELIGDVKT